MSSIAPISYPPARHRVRPSPETTPARPLGPVEHRSIASLRSPARNARKHSKSQIAKIAASIREFGFITPVLVDRDSEIIAGAARVAAARETGLMVLPTIAVEHLTAAQAKAYRLADNQLATLAEWDFEILAAEFEQIVVPEFSHVTMLGWETGEIDALFGATQRRRAIVPKAGRESVAGLVSQPGDL